MTGILYPGPVIARNSRMRMLDGVNQQLCIDDGLRNVKVGYAGWASGNGKRKGVGLSLEGLSQSGQRPAAVKEFCVARGLAIVFF